MTHKIAWLGVGAVAVINGVKVKAVREPQFYKPRGSCAGCVFDTTNNKCPHIPCESTKRPDKTGIIYKRVEGEEDE